MWQVLGAAGVAMFVGALVPSAAIHAANRIEPEVASAQSAPSSQSGARRGTPSASDDRKPRPSEVSASFEWMWWNDPDIRKQLNLSDEKAKNLQAIFQRRVKEVQPWVDALNREQDKLNRMTNDRIADEATYAVQVAKVQLLFSRYRESRVMMLYRMFRELQPEQYKKLQEIGQQRSDQSRGRGPAPGR